MIYLELFVSFFKIGLFTIGGGYAAIPLIQNEVIDVNNWLTLAQFTDLITIAEMTPGPIAINCATFVGIQVGGFLGGVVSTIGCIFPSCIIVSLLAYLYYKYKNLAIIQKILNNLRPAIVALIACAGLSILKLSVLSDSYSINVKAILIFIAVLFAIKKFKLKNPIIAMLVAGVIGILM